VYNDTVVTYTSDQGTINGGDILLSTAFPHLFNKDNSHTKQSAIPLKMLIIIRLYQQELVDMMNKLQLIKE
jgi:hypothetical protein